MIDYTKHAIDKTRSRWQRYTHRLLDELPELVNIRESCIIGSFSIILLTSNVRLLRKSSCREIDPGLWDTPSAVARDYLFAKYGRGPNILRSQREEVAGGLRPMPLMAIPTEFDKGYYIDIEACYWNLLLRAGWNVNYWPGRWFGKGNPPAEFPFPDWKLARNCLVSACISSDVTVWSRDHGLQTVQKGNPLANLQLYRLISDTLNCIATEARNAGAIYVNTDGYIAPDETRRDRIEAVIQSWGLPARIKASGRGWVMGPGDYKVGGHKSARGFTKPTPIHNIFDWHYHGWLKSKWQWLSGVTPP